MEEGAEMRNLITNFYKDLFHSCAGTRYDELMMHIQPKVSQEMNLFLMKDFSDDEIKEALDNMGDLKAPGADGMPALFYKQFWDIVGADIIKEVKNFLRGGDMPDG